MAKFNSKKNDISSRFNVNDGIRFRGNVRIVGDCVESKVVPIDTARKIALSMGMDLVEIQANKEIPIMRICRFDKMIYDMKKAAKKSKQQTKQLKEVQLSVNIARHDMETKANNARKFLENGFKVKVVLSMRGRELSRREDSKRSLLEFIVMLEDCSVPEGIPRDEGNRTIVILKRKN